MCCDVLCRGVLCAVLILLLHCLPRRPWPSLGPQIPDPGLFLVLAPERAKSNKKLKHKEFNIVKIEKSGKVGLYVDRIIGQYKRDCIDIK